MSDREHGTEQDHLHRKRRWAQAHWEVAKETGVVDESRRPPILPPQGREDAARSERGEGFREGETPDLT